jgi:hypothetical protein
VLDAGRLLFLKKICCRSEMMDELWAYITERQADEHSSKKTDRSGGVSKWGALLNVFRLFTY